MDAEELDQIEADNDKTVIDRAGHASRWHIALVKQLVTEVRRLSQVEAEHDKLKAAQPKSGKFDYQDESA